MKLNRTVQRTIEMMTYIAAHPEGVTLDEICETFSIPKTSAYDILVTLVHSRMLSVLPGSKQIYQTGLTAYRIGMSYPHANDKLAMIGAALKQLAQVSGRTAFFGKLSGNEVLYILKEVPENPIITTATVGSTAPLYCTALGKVLLSFLPGQQSEAFIDAMELQPRTERTLRTAESLRQELALTRERGYALDFREFEDHMVCASAPVYDQDAALEGAVSISGFYRPEDDYAQVGMLIRKTAGEISRLLGYQGAISGE